jgi:hypothetical protein
LTAVTGCGYAWPVTPMRPRTAGTVRLSLFLAAAVLVLAGCGLGTSSAAPSDASPASLGPSLSPSLGPSVGPTSSASVPPSPSDSSGPSPTDSTEPSAEPTPSGSTGPTPTAPSSASVCSGAKDTPDFYESFAGAVNFPVYCAVLPAGWSLVSGTYRLASGGHITISFRRRADSATFELDEGSFCADDSGCVPSGSPAGTGPYGDLSGSLVQTTSGFALVVAKGEKPSWLATSNGLDQATFLALTAALHAIT